MINVDDALTEVQQKSESELECDTAYKWASRALACLALSKTDNVAISFKWYIRASHYRHEALEHAALAQDHGVTLLAIDQATREIV